MTQRPERFIEFFSSPFVYVFLFASVFTSLCYIGSDSFIQKHSHRNSDLRFHSSTETPSSDGEKFEFSFCTRGRGPDTFDVFESVGGFLFVIFLLPPAAAMWAFISVIESLLPLPDASVHSTAATVAFVFYNAYWWITIAFVVDYLHGVLNLDRKFKPMISIFPGGSAEKP